MSKPYDAIVVGARCAGSPTAMLLARRGWRVLLVDRAMFPSDTLSTHVVHPTGVAALARWGLLDRLVATGCPPIDTYAFDFGPFTLEGAPGTPAFPVAYCPRRMVLDKLLVDAAMQAGAEVREGFAVDEIVFEDGQVVGIQGHGKGGGEVRERARVVVGADGRHSIVARAVQAPRYHERGPLQACYYTYWSDLPMRGRFETYIRPQRGFAAVPTHDGLTLVVAGWPYALFEAHKPDVGRHYMEVLGLVPEFAQRVRQARRQARFAGAAEPNGFRKPYGPGWALVGDAGYDKDPITAQGITDAFLDAERCASALHDALAGAAGFEAAMEAYRHARDERAMPMYEYTSQIATLEPPPEPMQRLLASLAGRREAMDAFVRMNAGTMSPAEFFAPQHLASLVPAAASAGT